MYFLMCSCLNCAIDELLPLLMRVSGVARPINRGRCVAVVNVRVSVMLAKPMIAMMIASLLSPVLAVGLFMLMQAH